MTVFIDSDDNKPYVKLDKHTKYVMITKEEARMLAEHYFLLEEEPEEGCEICTSDEDCPYK